VWVVKLGGSLLEAGYLDGWIDWLRSRAAAPGSLLVVPGGGPWADAVRALQPMLGASDLTAHRQALLSMQQYGWLLLQRLPAAQAWHTDATKPVAGLSVWLPEATHAGSLGCPSDWRTSSDALALELALELDARGLICVKSVSPLTGVHATDCFDGVCLGLAAHCAMPVGWFGPHEQALAEAWLAGGALPASHRLGSP